MIEVAQVTRTFGTVTAIDNLSFSVAPGEVVGLLGPNGSGKTTMIRLLCGVLRPDSGRLRVAGRDPLRAGRAVRASSGVLTESAELYGHLSGSANLRFFAELYAVDEPGRVEELLRLFGLEQAGDRPVNTYSTGMRKRLGLARALLHRPPLLFLDEPTNGLDPAGVRQVLETLRTLSAEEETTILLCSHLLGQLTAVCDRYVFIREGALLESGSLPELRGRWQPGVLLEVLSTEPLPETWEGITAHNEGTVSEAGLKLHLCNFMLPETAAVPAFLSDLADRVPLYGARLRQDSLEDIYFRIQELER